MTIDDGAPADAAGAGRAAFAEVYAAHFDALVRLASLLVDSTAAAEDVVQEAFARLHLRFSQVHEPRAWLRVAVVNGCRNERRRLGTARRHAPRLAVTELDGAGTGPGGHGPAEPTDDLVAAVRRLPHRQRAVVVLRYYVGLPEAEIAATLGIRPGTVKSSLHRALARLRTEVER